MGNPAGVLLDADGLADTAMQAIARAVGFNETAFVLPSRAGRPAPALLHAGPRGRPVRSRHRGRVRAPARSAGGSPAPGSRAISPLETGAGLLPVTVDVGAAGEPIVVMAQAPARFVAWDGRRAELARVLGIAPDDLHPERADRLRQHRPLDAGGAGARPRRDHVA